jgi:plasmid stabilization system protein ParE
MAKVAIRLAESALTDLESMRAWNAEQGVPEVGERLIGEIVASIEALADHPDMGRVVPEFDQPFLRELIRPPFRVVYRSDPKHVRIVRVWRSERPLSTSGSNRACASRAEPDAPTSESSVHRASRRRIRRFIRCAPLAVPRSTRCSCRQNPRLFVPSSLLHRMAHAPSVEAVTDR